MGYPGSYAYAAAQTLIQAVYAAISVAEDQAPTDFGTDFRVTTGTDLWQVQQSPVLKVVKDSNTTLYALRETFLIHRYVTSYALEWEFQTIVVPEVFVYLAEAANWRARSHIYDLYEEDGEPETTDVVREGNVVSWTLGITVLADNL